MSRHSPTISGGCQCGAVRYESVSEPINGGYCHCTICQKIGGSLHTVVIIVPEDGFRLTRGDPKFYRSSEGHRRGFCGTCGSFLVGMFDSDPYVVILVGTLDHPEDWPVDRAGWFGHAFVQDKVPWEVISDGLPCHGQRPNWRPE